MARYQIPQDPRDPNEKRPRRLRRDTQEPIPWRWLGLGVVVTIVSIALALLLARSFLDRSPLAASPPEPTIIVLTAPPTAAVSPTPLAVTPTPIPTFTPIPTPDTAVAPDEVTVNYYAVVSGTGDAGVTVRGGPSTSNVAITVANEGELLFVIGGPEADELNNRLWWEIQREDGTEGWVAGDFLVPAAGP